MRNYYVSTKIAASTGTVCGNGTASFSVPAFSGGVYSWTASPGITLNTTSGASIVATGSGNGEGWVQVVISSPCSSSSVTSRVNVSINAGTIAGTYYCGGCSPSGYYPINLDGNVVKTGTISLSMNTGPGVSYSFSGCPTPVTVTGSASGYFYINSSSSSQQRVDVTITKNTDCGAISRTVTFVAYPTYSYRFAPNPTDAELTVTAADEGQPATGTVSPSTTAPPFEADLYNSYGKKVKTVKSDKGKAIFDVRDLPAGIYNLRAGQGKEALSEHIQVTH